VFDVRGFVLYGCSLIGCGRIGFAVPNDADNMVDAGDRDGSSDTAAVSVCTSPHLVSHWPLDDVSGTTIVDVVGSHDGMWFDGGNNNLADERMTGHSSAALLFAAGNGMVVNGFVVPSEGTFSAWVTSTFNDSVAFSGNHPILLDAPTPRTTISYDSDMGVYGLRTNDVSWVASFTPASDYVSWFHLVATWGATGAQLYLDGVAIGTPAAGDVRSVSPSNVFIGTREMLDRDWGGLIDDVRFYDVPLSPSEVAELTACP